MSTPQPPPVEGPLDRLRELLRAAAPEPAARPSPVVQEISRLLEDHERRLISLEEDQAWERRHAERPLGP